MIRGFDSLHPLQASKTPFFRRKTHSHSFSGTRIVTKVAYRRSKNWAESGSKSLWQPDLFGPRMGIKK
jgi:hypothetical protein